jgi:hypothetical protein
MFKIIKELILINKSINQSLLTSFNPFSSNPFKIKKAKELILKNRFILREDLNIIVKVFKR